MGGESSGTVAVAAGRRAIGRTTTRSSISARPRAPGRTRRAGRACRRRSSWATIGAARSRREPAAGAQQARRPARGGHALLHDALPRGHLPRASQLGLDAQCRRPRRAARSPTPARSALAAAVAPQARPLEAAGRDVPDGGRGDQRRVEVVGRGGRDEGLRQLADAPHQMGAAARDPARRRRRPATAAAAGRSVCGQQVERGQLERQDRGPLLAARREAGQVARRRSRTRRRRGAGRRASGRSTAPSPPSRRGGAGGRRLSSRRAPALPSRGRAAAGAALPGRSRRARRQAARPARPWRRARQSTIWAPSSTITPSQKRSSSGAADALADRLQQVVALRQGARVVGHGRGGGGHGLGDERVDRGTRGQLGEPTMSSMSSGANSTTGRASARAPGARATPLTSDALAAAAGGRAGDDQLERGVCSGATTSASTRAKSAPQRDQLAVQRRRGASGPCPSTTRLSRRFVLPAALAPTTTCGPAGSSTSSASYERNETQADPADVHRQ